MTNEWVPLPGAWQSFASSEDTERLAAPMAEQDLITAENQHPDTQSGLSPEGMRLLAPVQIERGRIIGAAKARLFQALSDGRAQAVGSREPVSNETIGVEIKPGLWRYLQIDPRIPNRVEPNSVGSVECYADVKDRLTRS